MPFLTCPNCSASITAAEYEGGFCPRCRNSIRNVVPEPPRGPGRDREAPRDDGRYLLLERQQLLALGTVRTACSLLVLAASMLVLIELIALGFMVQTHTHGPHQPPMPLSSAVSVMLMFFLVAGATVYLIGVCLCMAAPERAARGWLAGLLLSFLISCLMFLIFTMTLFQLDRQVTVRVGLMLAFSLGVMHHIMLGLLATVSRYLRLSSVAQSMWIHLIVSASAFIAFVLVTTWLLADVLFGMRPASAPGQVFSWLNLVVGLIVTAYFVVQVLVLRQGIVQALLEAKEATADHGGGPPSLQRPPPLPESWRSD
jgi:hypothetical protein